MNKEEILKKASELITQRIFVVKIRNGIEPIMTNRRRIFIKLQSIVRESL